MSEQRPANPYLYPGTEVLRNLAGLRDAATLERFESQTVAHNLVGIQANPIKGRFDADRLRETHRRVFEGVYDWAGKFREGTGAIHKHRHDLGHVVGYGHSDYIAPGLDRLFKQLRSEKDLAGQDQATFTKRLAYYYGELDALHSFPDGNSRTLRQFTSDLAQQAGYRLDWSRLAQTEHDRRRLYLARDVAVMNADSALLSGLFEEIASPSASQSIPRSNSPKAVAFMSLPRDEAVKQFPDLVVAFAAGDLVEQRAKQAGIADPKILAELRERSRRDYLEQIQTGKPLLDRSHNSDEDRER